ncbi:conserved hypothetical protein [Exiguobacterium sp. 8H]|uniref:helix-turn-helix domain-containing protein n=1 Tax=unclassified Exiguobacterium TaxID=2644629 RepID=UPI0012F345EB|nr:MULTISPECIES: helix-turn-helix domain-containing protein [unclassified Exiguobacterium]VXB52702.1 conserved hypothetical protein [Exiguobacterium sp. 8A]VXB53278.1 conserved hypothetical protein [Exiguobacterium sp. 8H]
MGQGRINRVRKESNFVMMDKGFLQSPSLSAKAKGLLAYILSLPNDWILYKSELTRHFTDGKDSIRTALKELESKGYITQEEIRDEKGRIMHHNITVYEHPIHCGFTATDNPQRITRSGKPATTNNNSTNNDLTNNDLTERETLSESLVNHYQNQYGNIPATVVTAMEKFLDKGFEAELIMEAINVAVEKAKRWDYAAGILRKLENEHNVKTLEGYERLVQQKKQRTGNTSTHQKVPDWLEKDEQEQRIYEKQKTEELMSDVPTDEELMRQLRELRGTREATG